MLLATKSINLKTQIPCKVLLKFLTFSADLFLPYNKVPAFLFKAEDNFLASKIFSMGTDPSIIVIPWSGFLLLILVTLVNELLLVSSIFDWPMGFDSFLMRLKVQSPLGCKTKGISKRCSMITGLCILEKMDLFEP